LEKEQDIMQQITRRKAVITALAGATVVLEAPTVLGATSNDDFAKLIQTMEGFRTKVPPPQGLGELNGFVIQTWSLIPPATCPA
jgi:hypothetical protein